MSQGRHRDNTFIASRINMLALAQQFKEVRFQRDLTLRQVGDETQLSASTLSRIENGNIPDLEAFLRVCDFLGVNPASFFESVEPVVNDGPDHTLHRVEQDLLRLGISKPLAKTFIEIFRSIIEGRN